MDCMLKYGEDFSPAKLRESTYCNRQCHAVLTLARRFRMNRKG